MFTSRGIKVTLRELKIVIRYVIRNKLYEYVDVKVLLPSSVENQPKNLRELRDAIQRECGNLERDTIEQAYKGMVHRARRCLQIRGRTFSNE